MNSKQFFDWQTLGGGNEVETIIQILDRLGSQWCMIGGLAVNHWAAEPMATADVDVVIALEDTAPFLDQAKQAGFAVERFPWSIDLKGQSKVTFQISTGSMYQKFPARAVSADVHGIQMKVAIAGDVLHGKMAAWNDVKRRGSKKQKHLLDILRLVESHPELLDQLSPRLKKIAAENQA